MWVRGLWGRLPERCIFLWGGMFLIDELPWWKVEKYCVQSFSQGWGRHFAEDKLHAPIKTSYLVLHSNEFTGLFHLIFFSNCITKSIIPTRHSIWLLYMYLNFDFCCFSVDELFSFVVFFSLQLFFCLQDSVVCFWFAFVFLISCNFRVLSFFYLFVLSWKDVRWLIFCSP